jgi:hypothetical protein
MNSDKHDEHMAHSADDGSRWEGYDRGDANWDYDEAQYYDNLAFEEAERQTA